MNNQEKFNKLLAQTFVSINGKITDSSNASISIFDRGFLYGDSIYEVTYSEESSLIFFNEHIDRLFNSALLLGLHLFISRDEIIKQTLDLLAYAQIKRAYIRIIITRGETELTLDPNSSFKNNIIIIAKPQFKYSDELYDKGLHLHTANTKRIDKKAVNPNAKSGNYLNNVLAINEAKKVGADDAIMENTEGDITEGTSFNIWMVKDGVVHTPPSKSGLLKGITRDKVLKLCYDNNIPLKKNTLTRQDIYSADEVFITSSTKGIMPVYRIDSTIYKENALQRPMTAKLSNLYQKVVEEDKSQNKYSY